VPVLPNSCLSLTDGLQPLINPLRGLAILDPRPSTVSCQCERTHTLAGRPCYSLSLLDHSILSLGPTSMGRSTVPTSKGAKSQRRITGLRSKTTKAKTPVDRLRAANADLNNADLKKRLAEALEQQTATAEILGIISSSPTDLQPVFDTIVRNFVSLCGSTFGTICTFDGELVHLASAYGFSPDQIAGLKAKYPVHVNDRSVLSSRAILAKTSVHIQDVMLDPYYGAALSGSRRLLAVPMLREESSLAQQLATDDGEIAYPRRQQSE